jgi:uncharacterized protein (UPF0333 family)
MNNSTIQTVQLDSQLVLQAVQAALPAIEALIPAAGQNAQTINLATSAAAALLPLLSNIPTGGIISVQDQARQFARIYSIIAGTPLTGPEWQKQN